MLRFFFSCLIIFLFFGSLFFLGMGVLGIFLGHASWQGIHAVGIHLLNSFFLGMVGHQYLFDRDDNE